jgi:hypothetical protein
MARKPKKLTKKEQRQLSNIEDAADRLGYLLQDVEELLDSNSFGVEVVPKPLRRELLPTYTKTNKAITSIYDAVYAAQALNEELEHRLSDLDLD